MLVMPQDRKAAYASCRCKLFRVSFESHIQIPHPFLKRNDLFSAAWPADPQPNWILRATEHLGCCVLRPMPGPCRNAPARSQAPVAIANAHLGADGIGISG